MWRVQSHLQPLDFDLERAASSSTCPPNVWRRDASAQGCSSEQELQKELSDLVADFSGAATVYARHLQTESCCAIGADEIMPSASLIKVAILGATLQLVQDGQLAYCQPIKYTPEACLHHPTEHLESANGTNGASFEPYPQGDDIFARLQPGAEIALAKVCMLMASFSDNYASLCLQRLAGGGTRINRWLEDRGFAATRVNSRTTGREQHRLHYGWGQTTAHEMVELTTRLCCGSNTDKTPFTSQCCMQWLGPAACAEAWRLLSRSYWAGESLSSLPADVAAASKQGAIDASRSEVVVVAGDSGPLYAFCAITSNQADTRWVSNNEGNVFLRRVSAAIWKCWAPRQRKLVRASHVRASEEHMFRLE